VLHTLTGQEYKVKESITRRLKQEEVEEFVGDVVIPTEKVSETKKGVKSTSTRKFFPGYVLINVALYDEAHQVRDKAWYFVRETPGVIGFIGGEKPVPLKAEEVDQILNQVEENREKVKPKVAFEVGETVKITDGPFLNFSGVVEEIDPARGKASNWKNKIANSRRLGEPGTAGRSGAWSAWREHHDVLQGI
jgi:transcriptional antiterminator NusG